MILRARYVVPVDGSPIENGAVALRGSRITAVGKADGIVGRSEKGDGGVIDYGDAAILPGLVNAHTHLELTDLAGLIPPSRDFTDWLQRLFTHLMNSDRDPSTIQLAVQEGLRQSLAAGVTTIGDITRYPAWTRERLADSPLRLVSFGEVAAVGLRRHLLAERLSAALAVPPQSSPRFRIGVSPHAPYTVEPAALETCLAAARDRALAVCMHLAETAEEEAFTLGFNGPLADYLKAIGVWDNQIQPYGCRPVEILTSHRFAPGRTLLAHANYVSDADIETMSRSGTSVAYCPRTHAAFGHPPHRFAEMLAASVNVCLGTDSLASNPSLSILDEIRFLRTHRHDVPPDTLLAMATIHGAQALGFADTTGTLSIGKSADLVVIPLESGSSPSDWATILESSANPCAVYADGVMRTTPTF